MLAYVQRARKGGPLCISEPQFRLLTEQLMKYGVHGAKLVEIGNKWEAGEDKGPGTLEPTEIPEPRLNIYPYAELDPHLLSNPLYDSGIPLAICTTSGLREIVPSFGPRAHIRYTYACRNPNYALLGHDGTMGDYTMGDWCLVWRHMFDYPMIVDGDGVLIAEGIENHLASLGRHITPLQSQVLREFVAAMKGVPSGGSEAITVRLGQECAEVDAMAVLVSYLSNRFTQFIVHDAAFVCTVCEESHFSFARLFEEKRLLLCPRCDPPALSHGRYLPNSRAMHGIPGLHSHCDRMISNSRQGSRGLRGGATLVCSDIEASHDQMKREIVWFGSVRAQIIRMLEMRGIWDLVEEKILHYAS